MQSWHPDNFAQRQPFLLQRMALIKALRAYFDSENFLEVETPILQTCPVIDTHIHGFSTELLGPDLALARSLYLHTSPEFAMKKLLVAGIPALYQICHVFRNGEASRLHSPEFTMIEWYRAGCDYHRIMTDCEALLRRTAQALEVTTLRHRGRVCDPFADWQRLSVAQAFADYAAIDLAAYLDDTAAFNARIREAGIRTAADDRWDDLFFRVMAEKIEPFLGMDVPCILYDYPASMASLSRRKPSDPRFAERFELYACGVELANAFTELTDPAEQRARYEIEMEAKQQIYGRRYPLDEDFIAALERGLPACSGIALGVDRLAMLLTGADNIEQVLWLPV